MEADNARAEVHDTGPPVDVDLDRTMPDADAESGRGLALALRAAHELTHETVDGRNLWRVVRHW